MSPELLAILITSLLELAGLVLIGWQLRDIGRIQRVLAGLLIQESEKIQARLHPSP
jgi:hypothetical protein